MKGGVKMYKIYLMVMSLLFRLKSVPSLSLCQKSEI